MIFDKNPSLLLSTGLSSVAASEHLFSHPTSTFRSPAVVAAAAAEVVFSLANAESRLSECVCFSAEAEEEEKEEFLKALEKLRESHWVENQESL